MVEEKAELAPGPGLDGAAEEIKMSGDIESGLEMVELAADSGLDGTAEEIELAGAVVPGLERAAEEIA